MAMLNAFLVEDNPVLCESLAETLEELAPVRVVGSADDERSGIDWLQREENACDLVIIDVFLMRGFGLQFLPRARGLKRQLQLVVLSNWVTPDMRRRCLGLGADKVFDRANEIDELIGYCIELAAR